MVVFLSLCLCGGALVVVFLWWCFCAGVFVLVFLWWCSCGGVLVVVYKVLLQYYKVLLRTTKYYSSTTPYYSSTTPYYKVLLQYYSVLQSTTPYYKVLLRYYKVLLRTTKYYSSTTKYYSEQQSNTPVLLRTTKYYSSTTLYYKVLLQYYSVLLQYYSNTTLYYKVLLQYYSVLQSTTPTSETTSERRPSSTTPYYASTTKATKTSISCEASATFHRKSFQNDRFVRGFLQISQNKLPKRAFRAMLPTIFTEKASKRIVSREASSKFHRTSFQNERFARCFRQFSQKKLPKGSFRARLPPNFTEQASKTSVLRDASSKFHRTSFQNERFARCFRQFSPKICVSLQFRAIDTPIPARGFIRQKQNVPRTTAPCIPKFQNVRFATAACAKMYESIDREPTRFAHTKMQRFTTVLGDRHHVFTARRQMKFAFRYSFGRSTPRF